MLMLRKGQKERKKWMSQYLNASAVYERSGVIRESFFHLFADPDSRGLERGPVQWDGIYILMGSTLLCGPDDLWQLCALQPSCCHPGRRLPGRGKRSEQREREH